MVDINSVVLIGRITKDPEVRYTTGEKQIAVCSFTLAVDRQRKDVDADFIRCKAFGRTAELIGQYITKGRPLAVQGRIQTGSYKNKDGQTVYTTDVIVDRIEFIGSSKQDGQQRPAPPPQETQEQMAIPDGYEAIDEDEVPF